MGAFDRSPSPRPPRGAHWTRRFASPLVCISDVACRPHDLNCTHEICFGEHRLCFVRRGVFRKHVSGAPLVVDANLAAYFPAHEEFKTSHVDLSGDDCTFLSFDPGALEESESGVEPRPGVTHAPLSPQTLLASRRLFALNDRKLADAFEIEERALALLGRVRGETAAARRVVLSPGARHLALQAREALAEDPCAEHTLSGLALRIGASPSYVSQTFRLAHGVGLHRFLTRLRLAVALDRILGGEEDLSALAHDIGFSSHSHFTYAFRTNFGVTPSAARDLSGREPLLAG